jgi:hypothetical protein
MKYTIIGLRKNHLAVDQFHASCVDFLLVGLDFLRRELPEHLEDVPVEVDGFPGGAEAFAVCVGEVVLGDPNQRLPVDALVEVVLKIVVVFEEIGHAYFSPSVSV